MSFSKILFVCSALLILCSFTNAEITNKVNFIFLLVEKMPEE